MPSLILSVFLPCAKFLSKHRRARKASGCDENLEFFRISTKKCKFFLRRTKEDDISIEMLKNLVKKFTSHNLNDGEDVDGSDLGGPATTITGVVCNAESVAPPSPICSTPAKTYPALRSSTTNANVQYAQLRRNPLSSSGGQTAMATDFRCPKTAQNNNNNSAVVSSAAACTRSQRRAKKQQANRSQEQQKCGKQQRSNSQNVAANRSNAGNAADDYDDEEELKDSGTESDEELAIIETNSIKSVPVSLTSDYYTSQQSLSASCRSSHCGSPSLDQESVSWDSFGCESNVSGFRANNVGNANDVSDVVLDVELPNHHYHTRQQFKRFLKHQQKQEAGGVTPPAVDVGGRDADDVSTTSVALVAPTLGQTTASAVELSPMGFGQDSKNVFGLNYESVVADHQTPTDDTLYNKQLASPANSCGSSIDELESINGSSTAASEPGGTRDKNFADSDFAVPELNSHIGNRHRSSLPNPQNSKFAVPGAVDFLQTRGNSANFPLSNNANGAPAAPLMTTSSVATTTAEKRKWSQVQQSGDLNKQQQQQNLFVANFGDFAAATKTNHNYFSGGGGATAFRTSSSSFRQPAIVATRNAKNQVIGNTGASCEDLQSGGDSRTSTPTFNNVWKFQGVSCGGANGDSSSTTADNAMIRRQPVRLVIPPPLTTSGEVALPSPDDFAFQTPSNKVSPRKKYRSTTTTSTATVNETSTTATEENDAASENGSERQRPSLNFEKMREKLKNKGSRRKHQNVNTIVMKSKLRGWSGGYQLRSTHSECLFQPLRFPPSPPNLGAGASGE